MNILQMEDMVKGLPDQVLMQEAQMPSGQIPQFLALSEVQRRQDMRQRFQPPPQATVADQILQGGIASAMPQEPPQGGMAPPDGIMQGMPMGPEMGPPQGGPPVQMYGGGMVPGGTVYMQQGMQVPNEPPAQRRRRLQAELDEAIRVGAPRAVIDNLRRELDLKFSLRSPGELSAGAMNQRIAQMGLTPTMEAPQINLEAPDFSGELSQAMQAPPPGAAPAPPGAGMGAAPPAGGAAPVNAESDILSLFNQFRGSIGSGGGMPRDIGQAVQPFEKYFAIDPNAPALQATDLSPLIQQAEKRGSERAASYEQTIKDIEREMKRERLGAVLTTLGANLMAGEGALGLEKAGKLAQEMTKEARQEISAERRAARAAEEATADRIFALNAQQLTSNKEAQRAIFDAQQGVKREAFKALQTQIGNQQQAAQAADTLAATLASGTISRLKSLEEQNALNTRSFINAMGDISTSVVKLLEGETGVIKPEDRIKRYNELMTRQIRAYAAPFPNIDVESVVSAFKQDAGGTAGTTAQSGKSKYDIQVVSPGR